MNYSLIRILGNDLAPRHGKHQTFKNLEFTLINEQNFLNCKKHWLLNRIIDLDEQKRIVDLLERFKQDYTILPFELDSYDRSWTLLKKIQYLIQLNKARNLAINTIGANSNWILPFDGAIFCTNDSWKNISNYLEKTEEKLVKINMYRVRFNNQEVFNFQIANSFKQEEQVAIKGNSGINFDESLSYGYQNKVKLLEQYPNSPTIDYVIRLNDYTAGFITEKRYKDRDKALEDLINEIERRLDV